MLMVGGGLLAMAIYRAGSLWVMLFTNTDMIYAVTPNGYYYELPEKSTIRINEANSSTQLGYIRDGQLWPGSESVFGGYRIPKEVSGLSVEIQRPEGTFRLTQIPQDNNVIAVWEPIKTKTSYLGEFAWIGLLQSFTKKPPPLIEFKVEPSKD